MAGLHVNRARPHIIVVVCYLAFYQPAIAADEKDAIFNAWRQRQEQIHSLYFEWNQVTRKLSMPDVGERDTTDPPNVSSQEWHEVTQQGAFRLSGEKVDNRLSSENGDATRTPPFMRGSFDGSVSRRYGTLPPGSAQTGTGYLDSVPHAYGVREVEVVPLLLTYRPLHPSVGKIDPERAQVLPGTRQIGEHECRVLQTTSPNKVVNTYWIDTERDYVILRYTSAFQGHVASQLDIEYEDDQAHGWVLKKWRSALVDDEGHPRLTKEAVMTHFELNTSIPDSEFTFDFPDGTLVIDKSSGNRDIPKEYWVGDRPLGGPTSRGNASRIIGLVTVGAILAILLFNIRRAWQRRR